MAKRFSVKLRTDEFISRRSVTGPIWLEFNGQSFPVEGWYDFPIIILGFWVTNLKTFISRQTEKCECPFMDGPYRFVVTRRTGHQWLVTFIKNDLGGDKRLLEEEIEPKLLLSEILYSAELVIDYCKQNDWENTDSVDLETGIVELKKLKLSTDFFYEKHDPG